MVDSPQRSATRTLCHVRVVARVAHSACNVQMHPVRCGNELLQEGGRNRTTGPPTRLLIKQKNVKRLAIV